MQLVDLHDMHMVSLAVSRPLQCLSNQVLLMDDLQLEFQ